MEKPADYDEMITAQSAVFETPEMLGEILRFLTKQILNARINKHRSLGVLKMLQLVKSGQSLNQFWPALSKELLYFSLSEQGAKTYHL